MTAQRIVLLWCEGVEQRGCPSNNHISEQTESIQFARRRATERARWAVVLSPDYKHHDICGECRG